MQIKDITMKGKLYQIRVKNKFGFIDKTGKVVIEPKFGSVRPFSEELAGVKLYGKWGFIDKTGKVIIEHKFNYIWEFSEGFAAVQIEKKTWFHR